MESLEISWNFTGTAGTILLAAAVSDFYVSQTREDWSVVAILQGLFHLKHGQMQIEWAFGERTSTHQPLEDLVDFHEDFYLDHSKLHWISILENSKNTSVFGTPFSNSLHLHSTLRPEVEMATEKIQSRVWDPYLRRKPGKRLPRRVVSMGEAGEAWSHPQCYPPQEIAGPNSRPY